jgi:hypothetical protein
MKSQAKIQQLRKKLDFLVSEEIILFQNVCAPNIHIHIYKNEQQDNTLPIVAMPKLCINIYCSKTCLSKSGF